MKKYKNVKINHIVNYGDVIVDTDTLLTIQKPVELSDIYYTDNGYYEVVEENLEIDNKKYKFDNSVSEIINNGVIIVKKNVIALSLDEVLNNTIKYLNNSYNNIISKNYKCSNGLYITLNYQSIQMLRDAMIIEIEDGLANINYKDPEGIFYDINPNVVLDMIGEAERFRLSEWKKLQDSIINLKKETNIDKIISTYY